MILQTPPHPLLVDDIILCIGRAHQLNQDYKLAAQYYNLIQAISHLYAKSQLQLGWITLQDIITTPEPPKHQLLSAIAHLKQSNKYSEKQSDTQYLIGCCHILLQDYTKAYDFLFKALNNDLHNPWYWTTIGVLYYKRGEYGYAINAMKRAINYEPLKAELWFNLGALYVLKNDAFDVVLKAFRSAVELAHDNVNYTSALHDLEHCW